MTLGGKELTRNIFCPKNDVCFLRLLHIQAHFRLHFIMEENTMNPDQTTPIVE